MRYRYRLTTAAAEDTIIVGLMHFDHRPTLSEVQTAAMKRAAFEAANEHVPFDPFNIDLVIRPV